MHTPHKLDKPVVYTAAFGDDAYEIQDPAHRDPRCDFICFTDNPDLKSDVFDIRFVDNPNGESAVMRAKYYKFFPNEIEDFTHYKRSLWIDSTIQLMMDDTYSFIMGGLEKTPFRLFKNPSSRNLREEIDSCIRHGKAGESVLNEQYEEYAAAGYPVESGEMYRSGVILREIHDPRVIEFHRLWWNEVNEFRRRDEISFPYVLWKCEQVGNPFSFKPFEEDIYRSPELLVVKKHTREGNFSVEGGQ